jgi:hypothetical protein
MSDGSFEQDGRPYSYEILEIVGYDGDEIDESEIHEADQVFYKVEAEWGEKETFYRWIGGPFESMDDIEYAIEDETDFYADV